MIERILIAGGGTGGHVYPAVAVAEEVLARNPDAQVAFIGTERGMEARILPALGYSLHTITVSRLKGGGLAARILGLLRIPIAMFQSWRIMSKLKPQVVLGVGGYASGPTLLMAWLTCRKTAIQEQNATPGFTNRVLSKIARKVFVGFSAAKDHFRASKVLETGNPLRMSVTSALKQGTDRTFSEDAQLRVLVFGGSQGAAFLNEHVPSLLQSFQTRFPGIEIHVFHQTGKTGVKSTETLYEETILTASQWTVSGYINDMASAYANADLAITRAGALTIAELMAVGIPSLLVPFPFAADNHQEANARSLVERGACHMVRQDSWKEGEIVDWLGELAEDRTKLIEMSRAARGEARLDAAPTIVDHLEELAA
jgi:UDP-N-acetylglucosamine--N-acetylmuramyl-(pentapeptide) pyrophosphoryl-undecaprenol N-acetylglucosamine transferase